MGVKPFDGGWWAFEGDEPPGVIVSKRDEVGDPETARRVLRMVDDCEEQEP